MAKITLTRSDALFFSPLLMFEISEAEDLNKQLYDEAIAMRAKSTGVNKSNLNGWHSDTDFFRRPEPACNRLRQFVLSALRETTVRLAPKFDFAAHQLDAEGWININPRGAFNRPHVHPGFVLSGTYYVNIPSDAGEFSGAFEFLDPRSNANSVTMEGAPFQKIDG